MTMNDISRGAENNPIPVAINSDDDILPSFTYTKCNVPGPGTDRDIFLLQHDGCQCRVNCTDCICVSQYGAAYDSHGHILPERVFNSDPTIYTKPIAECNRCCSCTPQCENRVVQDGIATAARLQVFRTESKGFGLRTLGEIPAYQFVCEYAGEVLTCEEAKRRAHLQSTCDNNYMIALQEHVGGGCVVRTYVDPCNIGNVGRFCNHSCRPNLIMIPVRVDNAVPKLALFSCVDILPGKELTFDYSGDYLNTTNDVSSRNSTKPAITRKVCLCGTSCCRSYLPLDPSLY